MNYYEALGVSRNAEPQVIDAAYKAMMRRYHPDVFDGPREMAERKSKELNEAYSVLRDPVARAEYDRKTIFQSERNGEKSDAKPSTASEPWQWGTDPLNQHSFGKPQSRNIWRVAGPCIAGVLALSAAISSNSPRNAATLQPLAAAPTDWADVTPSQSPSDIESPSSSTLESGDCKGADCRVLTSFGWGGIEAGVSTDSAQRSSGMKIKDNGHYSSLDYDCRAFEVVGGPKNVEMLVEDGTVTTVQAFQMPGQPTFRTDRGVKLGDPEKAVRSAYAQLKQLPNIYSEPPDKMLLHYEPGGDRGIQFAIVKGVVAAISVGTKSIEYVEGCL